MSVEIKDGLTRFDAITCLEKAPGLPELLSHASEHLVGDEDWITNLGEELVALIPCVTDAFSRLRYTHHLVRRLITAEEIEALPPLPLSALTHPLSKLLFRALEFQSRRKGTQKDAESPLTYSECKKDPHELVSLLMGLLDGDAIIELEEELVGILGLSPFVDTLIAEALRHPSLRCACKRYARALRSRILGPGVSPGERRLLLDIAGEHCFRILTDEDVHRLWHDWSKDRELFPALLRYIGECRLDSFSPLLEGRLAEWETVDPPSLLALVDVLGQLEVRSAQRALVRFLKVMGGGIGLNDFVREFTRAVLAAHYKMDLADPGMLENGVEFQIPGVLNEADLKDKPALAQFVFHGDTPLPGQAGGSGVATLVRTLGDALAARDRWRGIYTLGLLDGASTREMSTSEERLAMVGLSAPGHWTIRIPVTFDLNDPSHSFMVHEHELARAIRRSLEIHRIDPDIFHIRYSDNASYAACRVAAQRGSKTVFTLTPDPHREIAVDEKKLRGMKPDESLTILNKIVLADRLVEAVDGYILIGHVWQKDRIFPYFPHLWLSKEIRKKPLRFIPEGIELDVPFEDSQSYENFLSILCDGGAPLALFPRILSRPILLNVGRLDPVKGQSNLVRAWASSSLRDIYNLVLIGGKSASTSPGEKRIREDIREVVQDQGELNGRICHLDAQPNRTVRLLERSILEGISTALPHVYLCSSLKEEFGLAILEAMSAGFLAVAPIRGGVGNYITSGENGFLIDTSDVNRLREGMESALLKPGNPEILKAIAQRGKESVRSLFGIQRIAGIFDDFYANLTAPSLRGSQS